LDEAIKEYREMLKINPSHIAGCYNLGVILLEKGMINGNVP
jgi:hypothetical protein